jgi:hypothetical protein
MSTVTFRPDYAKFLIECDADLWHHYYQELTRESHEFKAAGEWLKCHKVNRLWFNKESGNETWSIDIWGEWAGLVGRLPQQWLLFLKRYDVRAIIWDATRDTVLDLGQHLQRNITTYNVHVYNTKPASKRLGRDRGGVGFAIGSHKSDLRLTVYKRTGEPVAQEFQCSGAMLSRMVTQVWNDLHTKGGEIDLFHALGREIRKEGERRINRVLEAAGVGTYWPVVGPADLPQLPPIQAAIFAEVDPEYQPPEDREFRLDE